MISVTDGVLGDLRGVVSKSGRPKKAVENDRSQPAESVANRFVFCCFDGNLVFVLLF